VRKEVLMGTYAALYSELWISLASLLSSYTAAHGLSHNRQASIEFENNLIVARHKEKWLELKRDGASVIWMRENGNCGQFEITEDGRLRSTTNRASGNPIYEEEMDMAAESWAREIMQ